GGGGRVAAAISGRDDDEVTRTGEGVNRLLFGLRAVMGPEQRAETEIDDRRSPERGGTFEHVLDPLYDIEPREAEITAFHRDDVGVRRHASILVRTSSRAVSRRAPRHMRAVSGDVTLAAGACVDHCGAALV